MRFFTALPALLAVLAASARADVLPPQVAGSFYPADPVELRSTVDELLKRASTSAVSGTLVAAIVPHAGYVYSGETAARFYRLLKGKRYETVFILASGHKRQVKGAATVASGAMSTPLGEVEIDSRAVSRLRKLEGLVEDLPQAYEGEHSVEVQLPFLQRTLQHGFKIVPLLMNSDDPRVSRNIGAALSRLLGSGKTLLLVSSDLSHYPDKETARIVDTASLQALLRMPQDPRYFRLANRFLLKNGGRSLVCTYCGEAAVLAAQNAMKVLGAQGNLLAYVNSGELAHGDPSRAVGYAALVWTKGGKAPAAAPLSQEQRRALLKLSRDTLRAYLEKGEEPKERLWPDPDFDLPAAVFVTLRRKNVPRRLSLRGCIGSLVPELPLAQAVEYFSLQSALRDQRFAPVKAEELSALSIEISKLSPMRKVAGHAAVKKGQGVMLRQGNSSGLLLPSVWEDIPDKVEFLSEACEQKAGLARDCWKNAETEIRVFDSESFGE